MNAGVLNHQQCLGVHVGTSQEADGDRCTTETTDWEDHKDMMFIDWLGCRFNVCIKEKVRKLVGFCWCSLKDVFIGSMSQG